MNNWKEVELLLKGEPQKIIIISHRSPDGDSVGSSLAVFHYLKHLGHQVSVITPDPAPDFLNWLPAFEDILNFEKQHDEVKSKIEEAEVIFCLDFNILNRVGPMEKSITENAKAYLINIDHHQDPANFAHFQLSDTKASSTAEMVYEFCVKISGKDWMNLPFAQSVYTGILTDTGSFRFSSTSAKTHQIAAELIQLGVEPAKIHQAVFDSYSADRLKLLGFALNQRMKLYPNYKTSIIALSEKDLQRFNFQRGDTEGLVNFPLSIKNVLISILITEKDKKVKMSFRSKGNFKVNEIAATYFNGGGHLNAAGGLSDYSVKGTVEKLEELLPDYETAINSEFSKIN
ncbi:MAG: bifunctional oligoribonuclease/PAP phosphatase NrnA [Vicingaceae bacterium]